MASKTQAKTASKKHQPAVAQAQAGISSAKAASKKPKAAVIDAQPEVRSLETRLAEVTDRSEMLSARIAALELALSSALQHWPKGQGKLRKDIVARSKRIAKSLDKATPAVDRETWQKAVATLVDAIG